jgi:hypothetical protein
MRFGVFNALLSVLSPVLMVTGLLRYNPLLTGKATYDYFVWASTVFTLLSVYSELRKLRDKPLYSTVLPLAYYTYLRVRWLGRRWSVGRDPSCRPRVTEAMVHIGFSEN